MDCLDWPQTMLVIILTVAAVPLIMGLGVLSWLLWNMLRGKGGLK